MVAMIVDRGSALVRFAGLTRGNYLILRSHPAPTAGRHRPGFVATLLKALSAFSV